MNNKCGECKHCKDSKAMGVCEQQKLCLCPEELPACSKFEPKQQTVFNRIAASPEVLAEKLVYWCLEEEFGECIGVYRSTLFDDTTDQYWYTEREAIAATVARLKEVEK